MGIVLQKTRKKGGSALQFIRCFVEKQETRRLARCQEGEGGYYTSGTLGMYICAPAGYVP